MGSVHTSHAEKRKKLKPGGVEKEGIVRWQGSHPGKQANKLIETSLDEHFNGRKNWHLVPLSEILYVFGIFRTEKQTGKKPKNRF